MQSVRGQRFPHPSQMDAAAAATPMLPLDRSPPLSKAASMTTSSLPLTASVCGRGSPMHCHGERSPRKSRSGEDLRKWFLPMETTLFWYQFKLQTPEAQEALPREFNLPYKAVSGAEFESVKEKLDEVARSIGTPLSPVQLTPYSTRFPLKKLQNWWTDMKCILVEEMHMLQ